SATASEAERVAFGSRRVWISDTFGGGWQSIPSNSATDDLGARVRSLRLASFSKLYAGATNGRVFRFTSSGGVWTSTRIDNVAADIGVWRSTDGGVNWAPFSSGLPDAAVFDLDLHNPRRLLRASTYGRGVWEYRLDATSLSGVELYVRDTQLDQGRFTTVNFLNDPTDQS